MKKYIYSALLLSFLFIQSSCKKENVQPTQAEETAVQLQAVIKNSNLHRIVFIEEGDRFPDWWPADAGRSWSFSKGFVNATDFSAYNLSYLKSYDIETLGFGDAVNGYTSEQALILTFTAQVPLN